MKLGKTMREKKVKSAKASKKKKKKERQRSPNFARKARKCDGKLMNKTKGIEPDPKVQATLLKFLLNITLKHSLSL